MAKSEKNTGTLDVEERLILPKSSQEVCRIYDNVYIYI